MKFAREADAARSATIVPFSGGLDSFAGAVHELRASDRHVVLLSRRIGGMTDSGQRELANELQVQHPGRITFVPVSVGLTDETRAIEHNENITAERLDIASIEMLQTFSDYGLLYFAEQCRHWRKMAEIELERRNGRSGQVSDG